MLDCHTSNLTEGFTDVDPMRKDSLTPERRDEASIPLRILQELPVVRRGRYQAFQTPFRRSSESVVAPSFETICVSWYDLGGREVRGCRRWTKSNQLSSGPNRRTQMSLGHDGRQISQWWHRMGIMDTLDTRAVFKHLVRPVKDTREVPKEWCNFGEARIE